MADTTIGFNLDVVMQNLQTLVGLGDVVPPRSEMTVTQGASTGAASGYHERLATRALQLGDLVEQIRSELEGAHDAIKQTVDEFVAKEADQAATASALMASIDSMMAQDAPTTPTVHAATGDAATQRTALG